jgi:hypothetical protein
VYEFILTAVFDKNWNEIDLTDDDLRKLQDFILQNPNAGDVIVGTGGLRKLRWVLPGRGKRGGVRVLYVEFISHEKVILVNCYNKSEKDTASNKEKGMYKEFIKAMGKELSK